MTTAFLQLTDYDAVGRPVAADMVTLSAPLSALLSDELAGAAMALGVKVDAILVAAFGRAIQRTIGAGVMPLDVRGCGTSVLPLAVPCFAPEQTSATELLAGVHQSLSIPTLDRTVHGVLDGHRTEPLSDVLFAFGDAEPTCDHLGHVLELRASSDVDVVQLDWCFDARSFEPYTVQELSEQFPLALIEVTSEAVPPLVAAAKLALAH